MLLDWYLFVNKWLRSGGMKKTRVSYVDWHARDGSNANCLAGPSFSIGGG